VAFPVAIAAAIFTAKSAVLVTLFTAFVRMATYGVLFALGVSIISVVGFDSLEGLVLTELADRLDGLPSSILSIVALTRVDQAMAIILGAWTFSATLGAVGAVTRWRRGAPGSLTA